MVAYKMPNTGRKKKVKGEEDKIKLIDLRFDVEKSTVGDLLAGNEVKEFFKKLRLLANTKA